MANKGYFIIIGASGHTEYPNVLHENSNHEVCQMLQAALVDSVAGRRSYVEYDLTSRKITAN